MATNWQFTYNGFNFGDQTSYGLIKIDGLSPPDSREDILDRAGDHGSYVFAEYLPERRITFEGDMRGDPSTFESLVTAFRAAFVPRLSPIPLQYQIPGDIYKRVNAVPVKRTFPIDTSYSIGYGLWSAQFVCGDPRIYSDDLNTITVGSSAVSSGGFGFPLAFPFGFNYTGGGSGSTVAINTGVFPSPPSIRLDGPAVNPRIRNVTSDKTLFFNTTLALGEYLDIDVNKRTVFLNGDPTLSRYYTLDPTSVWWFIEPGSNTIQASSGTLTVKWRSAWI